MTSVYTGHAANVEEADTLVLVAGEAYAEIGRTPLIIRSWSQTQDHVSC